MRSNYCLPIIAKTHDEIIHTIDKNQKLYGYFEIWLDYLAHPETEFIAQLANKWPGRIIVLLRRQKLEPIRLPLAQRLHLLDTLSPLPLMLDLDISQKNELGHLTTLPHRMPLITSYHNYKKTPGDTSLRRIVRAMHAYQPDVFKLATFCHSPHDTVRLLRLQTQLLNDGARHIVLGMGAHGAATRVFGTLWGNELTFAPLSSGGQSAPGQLTRQQLERIFSELTT